MGKVYDTIDAKLAAWIEQQHVFFVATTPLAEEGHVNAVRSMIHIDVGRIADSCGYGEPLMSFEGIRTQQAAWQDKMVRTGGFDAYIAEENAKSIDGLPAL